MNKIENVVFTNMCMICDGDRVLVQDRRDSTWPGITFPGGHVEMGESFMEEHLSELFYRQEGGDAWIAEPK